MEQKVNLNVLMRKLKIEVDQMFFSENFSIFQFFNKFFNKDTNFRKAFNHVF